MDAPPTYSQQDHQEPDRTPSPGIAEFTTPGVELIITPVNNATEFQVGFLGAEDEHASIEGEVQLKGANEVDWDHLSLTLQTIESVTNVHSIELGRSETTLWTSSLLAGSSMATTSTSVSRPLPHSLPFSIPLAPDLPQSVRTPTSSITHILIATLHPSTSNSVRPVRKTIPIQITRFTSGFAQYGELMIEPMTKIVEEPVTVNVQVPRTTYRLNEPIPVYFTIPPPERDFVVSQGLRLRNVMVELVRDVRLAGKEDDHRGVPSNAASSSSAHPSEKAPASLPVHTGDLHSTVLTRSGAACRFHSSRPLQVRLVLHDFRGTATAEVSTQSIASSTSSFPSTSAIASNGTLTLDALTSPGGDFSQTTLLHDISFRLHCYINFTSSQAQHSMTSTLDIPLVILPPYAPGPRGVINEEVDQAYHKKYDRPPARTTRYDDSDEPSGSGSAHPPAFDEGGYPFPPEQEPGPSSVVGHVPPPSFDEARRDEALPPPATPHVEPFNQIDTPESLASSAAPPPPWHHVLNDDHATQHPPSFDSLVDPPPASPPPSASPLATLPPSFAESESPVTMAAEPVPFGYWIPISDTSIQQELRFAGEGEVYGFPPSEQYDGISHSLLLNDDEVERPPPPAATSGSGPVSSSFVADLDVAGLGLSDPAQAQALARLIHHASSEGMAMMMDNRDANGISPPPPPAMDDPSDPPPAIDEGVHAFSEAERMRRDQAMSLAQQQAQGGHGESGGDSDEEMTDEESEIEEGGRDGAGREEGGREMRPPPYLGLVSADGAPEIARVVVGDGRRGGSAQDVNLGSTAGPPPYMDL